MIALLQANKEIDLNMQFILTDNYFSLQPTYYFPLFGMFYEYSNVCMQFVFTQRLNWEIEDSPDRGQNFLPLRPRWDLENKTYN